MKESVFCRPYMTTRIISRRHTVELLLLLRLIARKARQRDESRPIHIGLRRLLTGCACMSAAAPIDSMGAEHPKNWTNSYFYKLLRPMSHLRFYRAILSHECATSSRDKVADAATVNDFVA